MYMHTVGLLKNTHHRKEGIAALHLHTLSSEIHRKLRLSEKSQAQIKHSFKKVTDTYMYTCNTRKFTQQIDTSQCSERQNLHTTSPQSQRRIPLLV